MKYDKGMVSGCISMLILKILSEEDMYGYQIIEKLKEKSNDRLEFKAGTLYPLLHSMTSNGYLSSYEKQANGKTRKYYSITTNGKLFASQREDIWNEYKKTISLVMDN